MDFALANLTTLDAQLFSSASGPRPDRASVLVKAGFKIGSGCVRCEGDDRPRLTGADVPTREAESTALRYESDFVPFKPRADVLCVGHAYASRGGVATESFVSFSVGTAVNKTIHVVGDRHWIPLLGRFLAVRSRPQPFTRIPVSFDHAYGGKDAGQPDGFRFFPVNPVGRGYSRRGGGLKKLALPNLEDPRRPVRSWRQRPSPMSFGPVGRTWRPRVQLAGTYDKRWLQERAPALPEDFNEAYYNCAPLDQQVDGYLRGDEDVRVQNMHPEHPDLRFRLPGIRVRALLDRGGRAPTFEEIAMNLDTLWIDMDALQFVLVWRGRVTPGESTAPGAVLVVDEPLTAPPRPAESYRAKLREFEREEASADAEAEAGERELETYDAEPAPVPAPAAAAEKPGRAPRPTSGV